MTLLGLSEKLSREPREVQPKSSVYYAEAASRSENGSVVIKSDGVVASDVEYKDVTAVLGPESFRNGSTVLEYTPAEGSLVISIDGLRLNPDEYSLNGDVVTVYSLQEYKPVEIHYSAPSSFSFYSHDAVDNHIRLPFVPVDDILVKRISSDSIEEATFLLEDDLLTLLNVDPYTDYIYDIDYRVSRSMAMETDNGTVSFPYDVEPLALTVTDISGNGVPYTMDGIYIHTEYNGLVQLAWNEQHSVSARLDEFDASLSYKLPELPVQGSVHILRNGNPFGGFTVSDEVVTLSAPQNNDYLYTVSCTAIYTELLDSSYFTAGSYRLVSIPEEDSVSVFVDGASVSFDIEDDILTIPDLNKGISEIRISYTALLPSQYLEIPTAPAVEEGDSVIVTTVNGVPTVTGVRGSGDKIRTEMDTIKEDARAAAEEIADIQTDIETFKGTVEATYAHQTDVDELTGDVHEMQSAVWEAENLSPFFGMTFGDPTYWYGGCPIFNVADDCSITQLTNGWAHIEMAGSALRSLAAHPIPQGFAEDGATYTLLVEIANHSGGSIEVAYPGANSSHSSELIRSDMGATTYELIAIDDGSGRLYLLYAKDPEADDPRSLMRALLRCSTGSASFDARLSLYKGTYSGDYIPYGQHVERYATTRYVEETAESWSQTISGQYLKKDGSNADSTTQYYTKTQIDQQVDNIYIGGDSRWTKVQDFTNLSNDVNDISGDLEDYKGATDIALGNLQTQLDGQIEAWYYSVDPTLSNAPAVDWTTEELRERHRGDLYYNVTNGHSWRWMYENSTWSWQQIPDTDAAAALATAQNAQALAGTKRRIFTATPVAPYDVGDLWVRTLNGYTQVWYATQLRTGDGTANGSYHEEDWSLSDTLAVAAKDIAASAGNPNLFPFFSDYRPLSGTSNQWYWMSLTGAPYTFLDNGWCHYERIHTGSSNWNPSFMVQPQDFIEPDIDYTVLLEIKNLVIGGTGTGNLRIIPAANNAASQLGNMDCIVNLRTQGEGVYRFKLHSRESDYETAITRLMYSYVNQAPDTELSFDFRVSLYKGDYQGDYKPYVFPQYETGPNLFEIATLEPGYLNSNGTFHAPVASGADSSCAVSDWIPVEPGMFYALSIETDETMASASWDRCIFYDANKESLGSLSYHGVGANTSVRGNFLAPANAAYVRISARWLITTTAYPETHCKIKFAKGRFCTSWTGSPGDTEAEIAYITENYATNASLTIDPTTGTAGLLAQAILDKSTAYTDGEIETEQSARTSAITAAVNGIEQSVEATYATKDTVTTLSNRVTQTETDTTTLFTVSEAAGNPNLFPFFSDYRPLNGANNWWYWQSLDNGAGVYTFLEDGWCHFDETTAAAKTRYWSTRPQDFIEPGTKYTFLVEIKNLAITGSGYVRIRVASANANAQFPTNASDIQLENTGEGVYRRIATSGTNVSPGMMAVSYVTSAADTTVSFDFRISIYKGDYRGECKPYVFPQYETGPNLFALSAIPDENKGKYLNSSSGNVTSTETSINTGCAVSDWIPVTPGTFYALSVDIGNDLASLSFDSCCYYDANKVFLGIVSYHTNGANASVRGNWLCPEGAAYVRLSARGLVPTDAYPTATGRVRFEKGRFCTAWTPAQADVDAGIAGAQASADSALAGNVHHGTCSTAKATAEKVVDCDTLAELAEGAMVSVLFSVENSAAAPTLNVNGLGAKNIFLNAANASATNVFKWTRGARITFLYNGTAWVPQTQPSTYYGTCSTAAATAAKIAVVPQGAIVQKGTTLVLQMTNTNTAANPTMNAATTNASTYGVGAEALYVDGARPTAANAPQKSWASASSAIFTCDGRYWRQGEGSSLARASAAQSGVETLQTMIRQFSGGMLVAYVGNPVGALVNADSTFDVVALTWNGDTPTIGQVYTSLGLDILLGLLSAVHVLINSSGFQIMKGDSSAFAVTYETDADDNEYASMRLSQLDANGDVDYDIMHMASGEEVGFYRPPVIYDGTRQESGAHLELTKVYQGYNDGTTQYSFNVEVSRYWGNACAVTLQFVFTSGYAISTGDSQVLVKMKEGANYPAPPSYSLRTPVFLSGPSGTACGYVVVEPNGNVYIASWGFYWTTAHGQVTYARNLSDWSSS